MRPAPLAVAIVSALLTVSFGAWPGAPRHPPRLRPVSTRAAQPPASHYGKSVGSPTEGRLLGGTHLAETPYLRIVPSDAAGDVRWGLEPLVQAIERAAREVRRQYPDAVTSVGHLSRAGGGDIGRHHSHESGRDADVGFFVRSSANHPMLPSHFVAFKADGSSSDAPGAYFDDIRNWTFVQALLTDPHARVTHVFIAAPLRARLLTIAERLGVSPALRMRAAEVMQQPRGSLPHDDHFHVRIACPAHMTGCIENPMPRHPAAQQPRTNPRDAHAHGRQRVAQEMPHARAAHAQPPAAHGHAQAQPAPAQAAQPPQPAPAPHAAEPSQPLPPLPANPYAPAAPASPSPDVPAALVDDDPDGTID